jgi:hypothetical protein
MFYTVLGFVIFWGVVALSLWHLIRAFRISWDYAKWQQNTLSQTGGRKFLKIVWRKTPNYIFWKPGDSYSSIGSNQWHGVGDWRIVGDSQEENDEV